LGLLAGFLDWLFGGWFCWWLVCNGVVVGVGGWQGISWVGSWGVTRGLASRLFLSRVSGCLWREGLTGGVSARKIRKKRKKEKKEKDVLAGGTTGIFFFIFFQDQIPVRARKM
jgi:hypothetical protein